MELRDYWRIIQRRWMFILATIAVCLGVAALLTFNATPQYSSSARLFVSTSQSDTSQAYQGNLFATQRVSSYADLVGGRELAEVVGQRLDLDEDEIASLPERVEASVVPETVILSITATDPDARAAQTLAQAYVEELQDLIRELETPSGEERAPIKATVVDDASFEDTPVSPQPVRNFGLAGVLGLLLGLGIAVLREVMDNTVKTGEQATESGGAPVLGSIAFDSSAPKRPLISSLEPHAPRVEAFRVLRTNMQFVDVDRAGGRAYVVSSSIPGEGKTTTSVNLALATAQAGTKVVVVEADLRRPRLSHALGIDNTIGLTTALVGKVSLDDALQEQESGLTVLPSGAIPPNPSELLQSHAMEELLAELRSRFDLVILDAPPLLPVTDAALIASQADGALLVARYGKTTKDQLTHAVERLDAVGARTVGVVLNMVPHRRGMSGYGYGYGYGYAPDVEAVPLKGRAARKARA
ncbi:polysaccharide biosynthesis tyrosine autokinase [Nocardioides campestrisoli]|uniref:polysaccharide biosynthesis tyrosine autokinase n=1 Tax=Nocardioides campestrisoli TaxID=2736757 RepID=UPI0015E6D3C5|nr:polysaccharide biosynthesis tyrosine autokinase [Nocardioides campestrisoli]